MPEAFPGKRQKKHLPGAAPTQKKCANGIPTSGGISGKKPGSPRVRGQSSSPRLREMRARHDIGTDGNLFSGGTHCARALHQSRTELYTNILKLLYKTANNIPIYTTAKNTPIPILNSQGFHGHCQTPPVRSTSKKKPGLPGFSHNHPTRASKSPEPGTPRVFFMIDVNILL